MKVIALNGSPRKDGNTFLALSLMADTLRKEKIETEIIQIGAENIYGCRACNGCSASEHNHCVIPGDMLNTVSDTLREADGFILASPTYYAGISGTMKSFLDRLFYSSARYFKYKVGTSISVVRRAGAVDVIHQLNNYLALAQMVIPPSQYWPVVYGMDRREILGDAEGIQTIQQNARAMAWLLKALDAAKGMVQYPEAVQREWTNFIR
ncbi:MAG: flavodoxin family protein [Treponema sp.]|jgi:multimeric flavodoxin WrbA|nr:flavodoxin family protein [Treponema sp.]